MLIESFYKEPIPVLVPIPMEIPKVILVPNKQGRIPHYFWPGKFLWTTLCLGMGVFLTFGFFPENYWPIAYATGALIAIPFANKHIGWEGKGDAGCSFIYCLIWPIMLGYVLFERAINTLED